MNRIFAVLLAVALLPLGFAQSALAQRDPNKGGPVEFYACQWQDGKDMKDLDKVVAKFNKWADDRKSSYSAWVLTPQFHSGVDFDIGWMGSWPSANDFGSMQDAWMKDGVDIAAAFDAVADCSGLHQMATSAVVNAPDGPPQDGIVMFSPCSLAEGVSPADALPAHRKMGEAMKGMGSKAMSWLFYPGMGVDDDLDYWSVIAFNNYTEMGAAMEIWTNGGGWEKSASMLGSVADCGSPNVYDARLVRAGS